MLLKVKLIQSRSFCIADLSAKLSTEPFDLLSSCTKCPVWHFTKSTTCQSTIHLVMGHSNNMWHFHRPPHYSLMWILVLGLSHFQILAKTHPKKLALKVGQKWHIQRFSLNPICTLYRFWINYITLSFVPSKAKIFDRSFLIVKDKV